MTTELSGYSPRAILRVFIVWVWVPERKLWIYEGPFDDDEEAKDYEKTAHELGRTTTHRVCQNYVAPRAP